ncbi:hypothetical protein [Streptomyces pratensis]|jgi:hypothetical protein|uniref:hypothetical protein n=1 Tax=Streptomyces pratensis TaxID=1169025 RepID=UPI0019338198|nr:hypothetical protein [Streptomyces pratensis]
MAVTTAVPAVRRSDRPLTTVRCVRRRAVLPVVPDGATALVPVPHAPGRTSVRTVVNGPVASSRTPFLALFLCRTC